VAAVLQAWYPGQEAGNAIADVLLGAEPGGRLPQTFPARWSDGVTQTQDPEIYPGLEGRVRYEEGVFIGYRHADLIGVPPLFPFGFGLSYTRFDLADLTVDGTEVSVTVRNVGAQAGSTVVQLYVTPAASAVARPARELKAFVKVALAAGAERRLVLGLTARDFAWFCVKRRAWVVEAGRYGVEVGQSAVDLPLKGAVTVAAAVLAV
ncbi:MAG: fibronectin type III-like domain-contianing protein, partial [Cypionkella sp.]|nr:fibronectin type III-like domain-contianing protein [Cypionkella sp.]